MTNTLAYYSKELDMRYLTDTGLLHYRIRQAKTNTVAYYSKEFHRIEVTVNEKHFSLIQ